MSNCSASWASVRSPAMAARATFALKAGVWFRRGRRCMVSPDLQVTACPPSSRNSTYRLVQISGASSVAANISDTDIHNIIQGAINSSAIPEPPANNTTHCIIIFLDSSIAVKDSSLGITMCEPSGDNAFGYHFFFTTAKGNSCFYSVIPALDDTCLKNTGCGGGGCSLSLSQTQ